MIPVNQFILGSSDPLLYPSEKMTNSIDEQIAFLQSQKQTINEAYRRNAIPNANNGTTQNQQVPTQGIWDAIDAEINSVKEVIKDYVIKQLVSMGESSPAIRLLIPLAKRAITNNINSFDKFLKPIADKDGMIDIEGIFDEEEVLPNDVEPCDVYVAINAQYHDYAKLFEEWFGGNIDNKVFESAITFWFKDVDFDGDKVWEYFHMNN